MSKKSSLTASALALAVSTTFAQSSADSKYQLAYLDPVVVTASRYDEDYRVVPAQVTYIHRQDIEDSNIQTVNEAITRLGGLVGRSSLGGGREQTIDMMGFGDTAQSNTIILLDGVPLNEADTTEVRLSGISIDSVEAIEIHRSAAGVLYGGGAIGGVINIITTNLRQSSARLGSSGSVYLGAGSFNSQEYRVSVRHAAPGVSLYFSGAYWDSGGYREHSASQDKTGTFAVRYTAGPALMGFSASSDNQHLQTPGPLTESQFRTDPRAAQSLAVANNTYNDIQQQRFAAFAEMDAGIAILRADGATRSRDLDAISTIGLSPYRLRFSGDMDYWALSARKPLESQHLKNQLLLGYEQTSWNQDRRYDPAAPLGAHDTLVSRSKSYFLKNDLDIKPTGTRWSLGYRSEHNERVYRYEGDTPAIDRAFRQHAAELGVSQQLNRSTTGYARVSRSYRFANLDEFSNAYAPDYSILVLRPQTSRDLELGVKYAAGGGGRLQGRVYQSRLTDEIIYDVYNYTNINLDHTRRRGVDADGSWPVSKSFRIHGAISIRDAEWTSGPYTGKEIPMSLPKTALLGVGWQPAAPHRVGLDTQWVASQHPSGDYDNLYRVPSYWMANLRYDYRVGRVDFSAVVRNLFDKNYFSYATVVPRYDFGAGGGVFDYVGVYPDNGRSLWASVRVRF